MNSVGSKEKREELRRLMHGGASFALSPNGKQLALDGLDIAQKVMLALTTMKALSELPPDYPEHLMEAELANWRDSAEWALDEALAEWEKWCS